MVTHVKVSGATQATKKKDRSKDLDRLLWIWISLSLSIYMFGQTHILGAISLR